MPWADVVLSAQQFFLWENGFYLMMCSLDELSVIIVNPTSACRDMLRDHTVIVAQFLETVIVSRGRHGIRKTANWGYFQG